MNQLIQKLQQNDILSRIVHTSAYCLKRELKDCESVLDLGCGPSSPLQFCKNVKYSVGVETFDPYLEESKRNNIHTKYLNQKLEELDFSEKSFDAIIMIEVLEHLEEGFGLEILQKAERWARKKIIITTPNGFFAQGALDENIYQEHLSGWDNHRLRKKGFTVRGMSGAKLFYSGENSTDSLTKNDGVFSNVRFKPKRLFYMLNGLFQIFTYYVPALAFGLFAVKDKK